MEYLNLRNLFRRAGNRTARPSGPGEAAAERQLAEAFSRLRTEQPEAETPLAFLRTRVEAAASASEKEQSLMAAFKQNLLGHPRLTTGLAAMVVLIAFVTLVPFPYEQTVGYSVSLTSDSSTLVPPAKITEALGMLGHGDASVSFAASSGAISYVVAGLPTRDAAREVGGALQFVTGAKAAPTIEPVRATVSGSLYAQVRERMATVEVSGDGKTDAEIEAEIAAKLVGAGFTASQVSITTNADGSKQIQIEMQRDESSPTEATIKVDDLTTK